MAEAEPRITCGLGELAAVDVEVGQISPDISCFVSVTKRKGSMEDFPATLTFETARFRQNHTASIRAT
jgi:hypothetical protein